MEAGYVVDDTGSTFIAATQRPDGTWRKPRKVKDGYVPQEEVPLYESKGKIFEKNQPKYPVGLSEEYIKEAQLRREAELKRQQNPQSVPGLTVSSTGKKKKKKKPAEKKEKPPIADNLLETPAYSSTEPVKVKDNEWTTVVGKSKATAAPVAVVKKDSKKKVKESQQVVPETTDPSKRVKNLRKKLREIEQINEKKVNGVKLEKDQLDKLSRKEEVEAEIARLISEFNIS